jgi:DNA polymerase-3 subunit gamma/tau
MEARSVAFPAALEELASLFHRIAIVQTVPDSAGTIEDIDRVQGFAERLSAESVQLAYQICVQGRADLALAPDETTGFSMTLLRLLAFEPASRSSTPAGNGGRIARVAPSAPRAAAGSGTLATVRPIATAHASAAAQAAPAPMPDAPLRTIPSDPAAWPGFVAELALPPMAAQLAGQTELKSIEGNVLTLALPATHKHLADRAYSDRLKAALDAATGRKWMLAFEVGSKAEASLAALRQREQADAQAKTEAAFRSEPFVQDALARFDAKIRPDSVKPVS